MKLRWKIWLAFFTGISSLLGLTAWLLLRQAQGSARASVESELSASFQAYESVWQAQQDLLATTATLLSSLPNVRAAFGTRDPATIRDSASELGNLLSGPLRENTFFLVADPSGNLIATIRGSSPFRSLAGVAAFPIAQQRRGFYVEEDKLFQLTLTPVFVDSARGSALISVLVAGSAVTSPVAEQLRAATGASEFTFSSGDKTIATSLRTHPVEALQLRRDLLGLDGRPVGTLTIYRTLGAAQQRLDEMNRGFLAIAVSAVMLSIVLSYFLSRRIVDPVSVLDRAAAQVAQQNYAVRIPPSITESPDELGSLGASFNLMVDSVQHARSELIRQERLSAVGRLASSIVHDLRNPLAAIYSGAELLVDSEDLPPQQTKRLATNIYSASRRLLAMLQEMSDAVKQNKPLEKEPCRVVEVVQAAVDAQSPLAQHVQFELAIPGDLESTLDRTRMERVFVNLIGNAIEMMPQGGRIQISGQRADRELVIRVADDGPGVAPEIRERLFQPFTTYGKRNGLGLGLALSRQTVLDHQGDLYLESHEGPGAVFTIRLPAA